MKICCIYNSAPHYRSAIFTQMDREWDVDWYFGPSHAGIKSMDLTALRHAYHLRETPLPGGYWQHGVLRLIGRPYDVYFLLGETRSLSTWLFGLCALLRGRRRRVYFWTHGWYGHETRAQRWLKKLFFRLAGGGIFTYGRYARSLMIDEGFDGEKIHVIHNSLAYEQQKALRETLKPCDIYEKHFAHALPCLVFVGRLTKTKKLHLALQALKGMKDGGHPCNMVLIGDGEMRSELEALTVELGITGHVWFYGPCYDEQQLAHLIYNGDLCVSPGNVGLTAMHAMVYGTPVITHDDFSYQMPEFEAIQVGKTGDFFRENDVASLEQKILSWLRQHPDREAVRRACYHEIDTQWTPEFQMDVLRKHLK